MRDAYRGQVNGLCGAAVPGVLQMHTGLHTGTVGVRIELHSDEPDLDDAYQDPVEVIFPSRSGELMLSAFESGAGPVDLPVGVYRARYSGQDMQRGRDLESTPDDQVVDRYLLQLWPATGIDRVVRRGSDAGVYWHDEGVEPARTSAD